MAKQLFRRKLEVGVVVVARALIYSLRIFIADDTNSRLYKIFSGSGNQLGILHATIIVVHQFESVLRRQSIA